MYFGTIAGRPRYSLTSDPCGLSMKAVSAEPLIFCLLPCFSDFIHAGDSVPLWAWLVKLLLTIVTIDVYASAKY